MTHRTSGPGGEMDEADVSPQEEARLRAALGALGDPRVDEMDDAALLARVLAGARSSADVGAPAPEPPASQPAPVIPLRARPAVRRSVAITIAAFGIAATLVVALAAPSLFQDDPGPAPGPSATAQSGPGTARSGGPLQGRPATQPTETATAEDAPPAPSASASASSSASASASSAPAAPVTAAAQQGPSADDLLRSAQELLAKGDSAGAAAAYRSLVARYPGSAEARAASMSLGRMALAGGRAEQALAEFDRYLASGGGAMSIEARAGRIAALRALGRTADEKAAIIDFLARHGGSVQGERLRGRLEELSGK